MPQQTDLISKFVKLSIRRGSSLASLSKSPEHLRTVVDAFRATAVIRLIRTKKMQKNF